MTYELYKFNLESCGFKQRTIRKVQQSDWNMVEMLSSKYPLFHARYMRTHYKYDGLKNSSKESK